MRYKLNPGYPHRDLVRRLYKSLGEDRERQPTHTDSSGANPPQTLHVKKDVEMFEDCDGPYDPAVDIAHFSPFNRRSWMEDDPRFPSLNLDRPESKFKPWSDLDESSERGSDEWEGYDEWRNYEYSTNLDDDQEEIARTWYPLHLAIREGHADIADIPDQPRGRH